MVPSLEKLQEQMFYFLKQGELSYLDWTMMAPYQRADIIKRVNSLCAERKRQIQEMEQSLKSQDYSYR